MALINCIECGKSFSSTLQACFHCGIELSTKQKEGLVNQGSTKFPRKKRTALLLAIFLGSVSYVYTWRVSLGKFLVWSLCTSSISFEYILEQHENAYAAKCLEVFNPSDCADHKTAFIFTSIYFLVFIVERIWVTIDVSGKPSSFYEQHPASS